MDMSFKELVVKNRSYRGYDHSRWLTREELLDMGLGGCMIGNFVRAEVSAALDLPGHLEPLLVVAVGKPDEEIVLTDLPEDGNTNYYRDAADVHYAPKRALEGIVL